MKGNQSILQRMTESLNLSGEPVPGLPLVEIAGGNRVLIENHCGIREYCPDKIGILVKYGHVEVCGCGLELTQMTKDQLIISGQIHCVSLHRRTKP